MSEDSEKKHFVLVHGFGHGAWCWYKLVSLLKGNGQRVSALDLGGCGINPMKLHEISSISDYLQPLMDFLAALPDDEKVILVGHSYGGFPIALAMEKFPGKVSLAVFVTAYMPNWEDPPASFMLEFFNRNSAESLMDCKLTFNHASQNLPITADFGPDYMAAKLYQHCPIEDLELGKMLIRPNLFFLEELGSKCLLSKERYDTVKRCYVLCEGDEVMNEDFQKYNIEKSPPNEVISIEGAGHMVMLTKPHQLCSCLLELSEKYA